MRIRAAAERDLERLREIDRAAGRAFAEIGMAAVAADEPPSVDDLREYVTSCRAWVAVDEADVPIGFVLVDVVDRCAYVAEVSVDPGYQRRGLGRRLVEQAAAWASEQRLPAVTLTTFSDVSWNRPYYERLGFHVVAPDQLGPDLRRIREDEAARGLDHEGPRVAMRLELETR